MNMRPTIIAALAIVIVAAPKHATGQGFVSEAEASRAAEDNAIVCKLQPRPGSRVQSKTCLTRQQWEMVRLLQQRDLREVADRPMHQEAPRLAAQTIDR